MKRFLLNCLLFATVASAPRIARAATNADPFSPLNWDEMKRCELVVVAHHEMHMAGAASRDAPDVKRGIYREFLTLRVDRVLKGTLKPGDSLNVEQGIWYSIQTYPFRRLVRMEGQPESLCYAYPSNSFNIPNFKQVVPDITQDAVYFLPSAAAPVLERDGQVQPLLFAKDWNKVLHGLTPSLGFRATQDVSEQWRGAALDELGRTRDPATLNSLFAWLATSKDRTLVNYSLTALLTIGDRKGDVYNRARERFLQGAQGWVDFAKLTSEQQEQYRRDQANNEGAPGREQLSRKCAQIMAVADGERAAREFVRLIQQKRPLLSLVAQDQLGSTESDYALDFAFGWIEHPQTVQQGAETIRKLLVPGYQLFGELYRQSTPHTAHLTALARARLTKVLQLPLYNAAYRDPASSATPADQPSPSQETPLATLRTVLGRFLPREVTSPVSLSHAEGVLLHPALAPDKLLASQSELNWTPVEKEGIALLVAIDDERDPRFIPLLVTLMHDASPWLKNVKGFGTISHYWQMFPHAFKSELDKQGLTAPVLAQSLSGFIGDPGRLLNRPNAAWSLNRYGASAYFYSLLNDDYSWLARRYASTPALHHALVDYCTMTLSSDDTGPDIDALHLLWLADPAAARPLIERVRMQQELKLLAERDVRPSSLPIAALPGSVASPPGAFASSQSRCRFLALAVAAGHTEYVDDLLSNFPVPPLSAAARESQDTRATYPQAYDVQVLLWPGNPRVLERYLQITDAVLADLANPPSPAFSPRWSLDYPGSEDMMRKLFAHHPQEFFDRILRLLRSPSERQRSLAEWLLKYDFCLDTDYDSLALTNQRMSALKTLVPLIERLRSLPEEPMRVALLQHFGITLPTNAAQRSTVLRQLVSDPNPAISLDALRLLELQTSDHYVDYLWNVPRALQDRLWNDLATDHALALQDMPTPLRTGGEPG